MEILRYSKVILAFLIGFVVCFHAIVENLEVVLDCSPTRFIFFVAFQYVMNFTK